MDIDDDESIPKAFDPSACLNRDLTELVEIDANSKKACPMCTIDNPKSAPQCYMCGAAFPT
jgi:ribosomal protein L40E